MSPDRNPAYQPRAKSGLTTADLHLLDAACVPVRDAFGFASTYLVGTAQEGGPYRDVDVRVILGDEEFDRLFGQSKDTDCGGRGLWELVCVSVGRLLSLQTGLPVDFQVQRRTEANEQFAGRPRNPIGTRRRYADGGDATPFERGDRHWHGEVLPLPREITEDEKESVLAFLADLPSQTPNTASQPSQGVTE